MSRIVKLNSLSDDELKKISKDLQVAQEVSKYAFNAEPKYVCLYEAEKNNLYVPFAYNPSYPRPDRNNFSVKNVEFAGSLRAPQKEVKSEAIDILNKTGSVMISCYCGFGKTFMALNIVCKIKMKVLILCHRVVLIKQWKEEIKQFCPNATCQILTPTSEMKDADFYIINSINVPKKPREYYKDIGILIVDEAHLVMAEKLSNCMKYVLPRYIIGLTATPYRTDGLDVLLDLYFGKHKIIRKLWRKHTVYRVDTGFKPDVQLNKMGKVDWSSVIDSTCNDENRNEMILKIIRKFKDRVFLVLCKRVSQANYLVSRLTEEKEDVTSLIGKNQEYEKKSRILVGTCQKAGVGFNNSRVDYLLLPLMWSSILFSI